MFGLSLSKLLLLAVVIGAVWYGFKWLNRTAAVKEGAVKEGGDRKAPSAPRGEDLTACPACGTFVPEGLTKCPSDRPDCPVVAK